MICKTNIILNIILLNVLLLNIFILLSYYLSYYFIINFLFFCRYNVQWYVAPLHIQKMMLFLLQRGTKAFHMILGGIFVASMESAATVRNIIHIYKIFVVKSPISLMNIV